MNRTPDVTHNGNSYEMCYVNHNTIHFRYVFPQRITRSSEHHSLQGEKMEPISKAYILI